MFQNSSRYVSVCSSYKNPKMKMRNSFSRLLALALLCSCILPACNKKQEVSTKVGSGVSISEIAKKSELLRRVPANTYAMVYWDAASPAYKRFASSPWGQQKGLFSVSAEQFALIDPKSSTPDGGLFGALTKSGIVSPEGNGLEKSIGQFAAFLCPAEQKGFCAGAVFISGDEKLGANLKSLCEELKKNNNAACSDVALAQGEGFSLNTSGPGSPTVFIGWKDKYAAVASSSEMLSSLLVSPNLTAPALISSEQTDQVFAGMDNLSDMYAFAVADVKQAVKELAKGDSGGSFDGSSFGKLAITTSMTTTPSACARLTYETSSGDQAALVKTLGGSSHSAAFLKTVSGTPFVFASVDGKSVAEIAKSILAQSGTPVDAAKEYVSLLSSLKRIGLSANVPALSQSLLPAPEVLLVLESEDAAAVSAKVKAMLGTQLEENGIPAQWQEMEIAKHPAQVIDSGMGVGAFLANGENGLVLLATSKRQLEGALQPGEPGAFANTPRSQKSLSSGSTVLASYVDFVEVASLLENLRGLFVQFAPQNSGAQNILDQQTAEFKKMGVMTTTVSQDKPGMIDVRTFYEMRSGEGSPS